MTAEELLTQDFGTIEALIRARAIALGAKPALIDPQQTITYAALDQLMDRIAASLQRDGVGQADAVAICAANSAAYGAAFFGILRAGAVVAPLAPTSSPESLLTQIQDCGAKLLFLDHVTAAHLGELLARCATKTVALDGSAAGLPLNDWLEPAGAKPVLHRVAPQQGFNIIYSSGTTSTPKGIIQPHSMRWHNIRRVAYPGDAVTLISTPLYSNTTLVCFLPTIAYGATAVLLPKFDALQFLEASSRHRATHAMLVPVQYRRLMDHPKFDAYDLSSFRMKFSTSAPFAPDLKREVLRRWPGGLTEFYGMTEGGGSCALFCHDFQDKLHTVGRPMPGHDIRLIDQDDNEVPPGGTGEIVGHSGAMMVGYHNQSEQTRAAEWYAPDGSRFIRTGDIGRFDADGFLILVDRKKDMILSGGFNIYPSDLEAALVKHDAVAEAAVVGVESDVWGETPVAFVTLKPDQVMTAAALKDWINARLGKTQRLADLRIVDGLPRSPIGKILKRELRELYAAA